MPVSCHLGKFPPDKDEIDWADLVLLLGKANRALASYDGVIGNIPNVKILLAPLAMQEAALSSRI